MQTRPARSCVQKSCAHAELFAIDDEGSDFAEVDEELCSEHSDESYDAQSGESDSFDKKKGEDDWVGRRVVKTFGHHGDFEGVVYAVDNDKNKSGYRLFAVYYFDDPDDGETMWPEELFRYVNYFVSNNNN